MKTISLFQTGLVSAESNDIHSTRGVNGRCDKVNKLLHMGYLEIVARFDLSSTALN